MWIRGLDNTKTEVLKSLPRKAVLGPKKGYSLEAAAADSDMVTLVSGH